MPRSKPISLDDKPLGSGRFPAICTPLVGRTRDQLLDEVASVAARKPDLLEWRVDFFESIADTAEVIDVAGAIRGAAGSIPLLFTRRSMREGGERIDLAEEQVVALYRAVCASGHVDLIDYEMSNDPAHVAEVRELSNARGVKLILSFHDFGATPPLETLLQRFAQAAAMSADVAKVAVMPRSMDDVLVLLNATLQASRTLEIPVVSMAMGGMGALTRMCGFAFGSALTFAVGQAASAPGQMPLEHAEAAIAILQKAMGQNL
jgi:3-dehydroquinate dehydratase-1